MAMKKLARKSAKKGKKVVKKVAPRKAGRKKVVARKVQRKVQPRCCGGLNTYKRCDGCPQKVRSKFKGIKGTVVVAGRKVPAIHSVGDLRTLMLKAALEATKPGVPMREDPMVLAHREREERCDRYRLKLLPPPKKAKKVVCRLKRTTRRVKVANQPLLYRVGASLDGKRMNIVSMPTDDVQHCNERLKSLDKMYPQKIFPNRLITLL